MNKLLRRLPLQTKLLLIGLIPFSFLIYLTIEIYHQKTEKLALFTDYKNYLDESSNINGLIDALQEERKFSFDYAITKNRRQELVLQRPKTDALLQKLIKSGDPALEGFTEYTKLGELDAIRKRVDNFTIRPDEVMHFYTNTAFRLNTLNTLPPANTAYLQSVYKDLMVQDKLSEMITYLGIIRSNIYNVLHTRQYMVETLMGTYGTYDVYKSYEKELLAKATPELLEQYKSIRNTTALKPTTEYIDTVFKHFAFDESFTAAEWWQVSDKGTDELRKLQLVIWKNLNAKLDQLYREQEQSRNNTLLFLIFALLAVFGIVTYIVYIISRSLTKLRLAAEKIANGITGITINPESDDAIGKLAVSIAKIDQNNRDLVYAAAAIGQGDFGIDVQPRDKDDALGNAIVEMKTALQQYNLKMEELVVERTEELARSNEDLQQFAHVASHDLKEPLRKIMMFSNILMSEQKEALTDKGKLYLQKIENASERMSIMIEGVLAYSTLSVHEPPAESVNLNVIMEGVMDDLELAIIQKEAQILYKNLPYVNGIPLLLHQLFYNLVNNALKFSQENIPPVITITSKNEMVKNKSNNKPVDFLHITVSDNGIGFNPVYAEKIFGVFSRLNAKDKYDGTGLGLALCKKIVVRHKGEIYAEGNEGTGASFHILLPIL